MTHHSNSFSALQLATPGTPVSAQVVFIFDDVPDWQTLAAGAPAGAEVVVLNGRQDGLEQMAAHLQGHSGVEAIHVVSHGDSGRVQLGTAWLDSANILERGELLAEIGRSLAPDGDILLYGCRTGAESSGAEFLQRMALATGADVAASDDLTGSAQRGGDWALETHSGPVEAAPLAGGAYQGLLAGFTDTYTANFGSGVTTFTSTLAGVSFTYTFNAGGDGGDFAWDSTSLPGQPVLNVLSAASNTGTTESFSIARTDGLDFTFDSLLVDNAGTSTGAVSVQGYLDGNVAGPAQTMNAGSTGTLNFSGLRVDEVRISSVDFGFVIFDNFSGDTNPPNTTPAATNLSQTVGFTEDAGSAALGDIVITDPDAGDTLTATLTLANASAGSLSTGTFGTSTSTYDAVTGVWEVSGSQSDVNAALASVAFTPAANWSQNTSISTRVRDAAGAGPADGSITLNATGVNDAPVATVPLNIAAMEDAASALTGISFSDVDAGASPVTATLNVGSGSLAAASGGGVTVGGTASTLTLTGSVANINAFISGGNVTFTTAANATSNVTLTVDIHDGGNSGGGGALTDAGSVTLSVTAVNDAPTIAAPPSTAFSEDTAGALTGISFADVDAGSASVTVTLSVPGGAMAAGSGGGVTVGGTPTARTLTGSTANVNAFIAGGNVTYTPAANASGNVTLTVAVDDGGNMGSGGAQSACSTVTLAVANANDAPTVANIIPNQNATEDAAFNFQFAANTFVDVDAGATLAYSAQLAGGGSLPAWLNFDPATRTFSGTPANGDVGTLSVEVTASDGNGGTASDTFDIVVANTNDAPTVANAISNQNATQNTAFNFTFAANAFADVDVGDTLTYSAQLAGGGPLPAWLSFDPATRTFGGTPASGDVGTVSIDVIASDGLGGSASDTFDIVVGDVNDAPTVANAIADQSATEDTAFSFQFAANIFADQDAGDTLTYGAQLAGGGALPGWLSFDPVTRTFSGTPLNGNVGTVSIDVLANDGHGGTVTDTFDIVVANTNDAPTVANAIPNRSATEGVAFNFQFAANTFADVDVGDTLAYSAQLAGGGPLPAWLSFDPATRTFSGTPAAANIGTLSIEVVAGDGHGGTATDAFDLVVAATPADPEPPTPLPPTPPTPPTPGVPDNDGIPGPVEDQAPGIPGPGGTTVAGDGNGDGIKDSEQPSVGSIGFVLSPSGESNPGDAPPTFTTLVASSQDGKVGSGNDNSRITSLRQLDAPQDLPEGLQTPIGLVSFTVELAEGRSSESFSLYLDPALGVNGYWKQDASGTWVNLASEPYGGKMVLEGGRVRLDFQIVDGGQFDADGRADGVITDPGAPGHMPLSIVGLAPDMPQGFWF